MDPGCRRDDGLACSAYQSFACCLTGAFRAPATFRNLAATPLSHVTPGDKLGSSVTASWLTGAAIAATRLPMGLALRPTEPGSPPWQFLHER